MSRYYELMQEMEKDHAFPARRVVEPAFPIPGESRNRKVPRQLTRELTQGLVQRIFLQQKPGTPHLVVFAAVDPGGGCSQIAAMVA
jgi:hypothetical protein